jgi:1-acyl-sn-glycerol-3-phosphate acyltransferase
MSVLFLKTLMEALRKIGLLKGLVYMAAWGYYLYFRLRNNFKVVGLQYLPPKNRPRYILAGNHASGADAYLLLAGMTGRYLRRIYAVAHEKSFRKETPEKLWLEAMEMIPRVGSGQEIVDKMACYIFNNRTIAIVPEGMYSTKVMKGYTGIMRLYWRVNRQFPKPTIPIIPVATIGATEAYPFEAGSDGKYHMKKTGIIARLGPPIFFDVPAHPPKDWFREKTDEVMKTIANLGLQKEVIESWKLESMERKKPRKYKI